MCECHENLTQLIQETIQYTSDSREKAFQFCTSAILKSSKTLMISLFLVMILKKLNPPCKGYQIGFTNIMFQMQHSNKILRKRYDIDEDSYHNAMVKNWEWLRKNLSQYDSKKGCIFAWFNTNLSFRIQDEEGKRIKKKNMIQHPYINQETGEIMNPIDLIPAPPEIPNILEEARKWIEDDKRELTRIHVRDCPEANSYILLLRRLPPSTPWNKLAEEFNKPASTLHRHYNEKCLPRLKQWGKEQGYWLETSSG